MRDPFADAQAWYDRAQEHITEYRTCSAQNQIWTLNSSQREDSRFVYSLRFNRGLRLRVAYAITPNDQIALLKRFFVVAR